jgi:hypothetical protein
MSQNSQTFSGKIECSRLLPRPSLAHLMLFDPRITLEISTFQYLSFLERRLLRLAGRGNQAGNESFSVPLFDR